MAQTSRDFGELLHRSLATVAASIEVGEDGLDKIWVRLERMRSSRVAHDREIAVRRAWSGRASQPSGRRAQGGRLTTRKIPNARAGHRRSPGSATTG